jgi:hypothetical protein
MQLNPDAHLSELIESAVRSGRFSTPEELVAAGVHRVIAEDGETPHEGHDLPGETDIGLRDAAAGNFVDFTAADVIAACKETLDQRRRGKA